MNLLGAVFFFFVYFHIISIFFGIFRAFDELVPFLVAFLVKVHWRHTRKRWVLQRAQQGRMTYVGTFFALGLLSAVFVELVELTLFFWWVRGKEVVF